MSDSSPVIEYGKAPCLTEHFESKDFSVLQLASCCQWHPLTWSVYQARPVIMLILFFFLLTFGKVMRPISLLDLNGMAVIRKNYSELFSYPCWSQIKSFKSKNLPSCLHDNADLLSKVSSQKISGQKISGQKVSGHQLIWLTKKKICSPESKPSLVTTLQGRFCDKVTRYKISQKKMSFPESKIFPGNHFPRKILCPGNQIWD